MTCSPPSPQLLLSQKQKSLSSGKLIAGVFTEIASILIAKCEVIKTIPYLFEMTKYGVLAECNDCLKQQKMQLWPNSSFFKSHLHIKIVSLLSHCESAILLRPTGKRRVNFRSLFSNSNRFPWFLKGCQFSWIQAELKGALLPVRWGRTSAVTALSHASTTGPRPQADRGDTCSLGEVGQHLKS